MTAITSVGIIGLGNFGMFVASLISSKTDVKVYGFDTKEVEVPKHVRMTDLETVAKADVVLLTLPLDAYPQILEQLREVLRPDSLLVDACSVKVRPQELIAQYLPEHANLLLVHPLFGPHSAINGIAGHKVIVTKCEGAQAEVALRYCEENLHLQLHRMSSEEHDVAMARVHVLTSFVARGLANLNLPESPFVTPSYEMIQQLVEFDRTRSDDLFQTIQHGNPYAEEVRQQVVQQFTDLAVSLRHTR